MDNTKPALSKQVKFTTLQEEALIIAQDDNKIHILNEVAAFLLPFLDGNYTFEEIIEKVLANFEVSENEARRDVAGFLDNLQSSGLIDCE